MGRRDRSINDEFKLTGKSYLTSEGLKESVWGAVFDEDLETADCIVIIGLSLDYDLDFKRFIFNKNVSNKTVFIESSEAKEDKRRKLERLGKVKTIGMKAFVQEASAYVSKYSKSMGKDSYYKYKAVSYTHLDVYKRQLYSWVFVNGQSLHGMNAYIGIVMAGYVLLSFQWRKRTNRVAGMLNLALLLYICNSLGGMESPGTDFFAMCLMLYLLARWFRCKYMEEKYILCILAAFGVTLKLSIAPVVLLTAVPAIWLIKGKKWKETAVCLGSGLRCV